MAKRIILEEGKLPELEGQWTVGEVITAAETLSRWVQSFHVNGQEPDKQPTDKAKAKEG